MCAAEVGSPAAPDQVRTQNTALVLRALRDTGPASRADIAKSTGLAKGTVGTIVGKLAAVGAVTEREAVTPARGRPSRPVAVDGALLVGLGVEINVDYVSAVALDLSGRTVLLDERTVPASSGGVPLDDVRTFIGECHDRLVADGRRVLGLTVAIPGLVDRNRGRVVSAPNLGWADVDLVDMLAPVVDDACAVRVDNDANCAALAEASRGVAVGATAVLYLTGTVGVGGGIVLDGQVVRGANGYAGEVGHMRVGESLAVCGCGRTGCWEAVVGLRAMLDAVGMSSAPDRADPVEVARLVAERADSDAGVRAGLAEVGRWLARGTSVLANALNPSVIVLGGYFEPLGAWLVPEVERSLDDAVFARGDCVIALSSLGLRAAAIGAATEVLVDVYDARVPL